MRRADRTGCAVITAVLTLLAMTLARAGLHVLRVRRAAADVELRRVLGPPPRATVDREGSS